MPTEMELTLEQTQQGVSYEVSVFTMKMEILLEPTSNKLMVAGNPVKKILLKLNLSDHRSILTDLKVTPTKPGRMTKPYSGLSLRFEGMSMLVQKSQIHKMAKFQDGKEIVLG
ncbi:hypothetical protein Tco_0418904 [Tanacetum coccineum]